MVNEVVFKVKKTGHGYRYTQYQAGERAFLERRTDNYYLITNLESIPEAEACIDGLICCLNRNDRGQQLTILLNEKTNCYDISVSLPSTDKLKDQQVLIFNKHQLMRIDQLTGEQINKMYENAVNRGKAELKVQEMKRLIEK